MTEIREKEFCLTAEPGGQVFGEVHLETDGAKPVRGEFCSNRFRIIPEKRAFSGRRVKLRFGADASGLSDGDVISGSLFLITEEGETEIPVSVRVEDRAAGSSAGPIRNMDDFLAFAEHEPREAFRLFRSDRFGKLAEEGGERILWEGLRKPPAQITAMEEFLVASGRKEPVEIHAESDQISFWSLRDSVQEILTLRRSTWGAILIEASSDADFIELPRTRITDADFVGSAYDFEYRVNAARLGEGVRRGTIRLKMKDGVHEFKVTASLRPEHEETEQLAADREWAALYGERLRYMLKETDRREYAERSLEAVGNLFCTSSGNLSLLRLYQVYLEEQRGNRKEAESIFREFGPGSFSEEEKEEEAARLYLGGLLRSGGMRPEEIAEKIRELHAESGGSYLILRLLFLTNPDIGRYPRRKIRYAEELYRQGVRSPLLYADILADLRDSDSLLTELSDLMLQVLLFAVKRDLLTKELALRAAYLSDRLRSFSPVLFRILTEAYRSWPYDGILEAVVKQCMKGEPGDPSCFPWYELAVQRKLRVIRLYEYYIETMPAGRRQLLPLAVRKYFMYNSTLPESGMAAVYANILRNRHEDPDTFAKYRERARVFAYDSLRAGRCGGDYAALYQEFITEFRGPEEERTFADTAFAERIYCDTPGIRSVVVIHGEMKLESVVPLSGGSALVRIYTPDAVILFEDAGFGRRAEGVPYAREPLMERERAMKRLAGRDPEHPGFLLHAVRCPEEVALSPDRLYAYMKRIAGSEIYSDAMRGEARKYLLRSGMRRDEPLPEDLSEEELRALAAADKEGLVKRLISDGRYRDAFGILSAEGPEGVKEETCLLLTSRVIRELEGAEDEEVTALAAEVFRAGRYDEPVLAYLERYDSGCMEEMLEIRRRAAAFYVDTRHIDARILSRVCFTGRDVPEGPAALRNLEKAGGYGVLVRRYLEFTADRELGSEDPVSPFTAECISRLIDDGESVDFAMKLLLLKYYSQKDGLTVHEEVLTDELLAECEKRNIHLAFMKNLPASFVSEYRLEDRVCVEARAEAGETVRIRYSFGGEGEEWKTETLQPVFRTLCVKEFTLFYGETLSYELTALSGEAERPLKSGSVTCGNADFTGRSAWQRINRMLKLKSDGDQEALLSEIREYRKDRARNRKLFILEESL